MPLMLFHVRRLLTALIRAIVLPKRLTLDDSMLSAHGTFVRVTVLKCSWNFCSDCNDDSRRSSRGQVTRRVVREYGALLQKFWSRLVAPLVRWLEAPRRIMSRLSHRRLDLWILGTQCPLSTRSWHELATQARFHSFNRYPSCMELW